MDGETSTNPPIIGVRGLAIGWGDNVLAKDVTFHVDRGEVFAILGESGSGKTTLVRFIIGLEEPLAGEIDVAGEGRPNLERGLPPFGVMFQSGALFGSMTVRENVQLPLEEWTNLPLDAIGAIANERSRSIASCPMGVSRTSSPRSAWRWTRRPFGLRTASWRSAIDRSAAVRGLRATNPSWVVPRWGTECEQSG